MFNEVIFYTSGHIKFEFVKMKSSTPKGEIEHESDNGIVIIWCALAQDHIISPLFFAESTLK